MSPSPAKEKEHVENDDQSDDDSLDGYYSAPEPEDVRPTAAVDRTDSISIESLFSVVFSAFFSKQVKKPAKQAKEALPIEMILHLTSYVSETQRSELYSLMGINKTWNRATTKKYWKNIHIQSNHKWRHFVETCLQPESPGLHEYTEFIQFLQISKLSEPIASTSWIEVIKQCSQLKHLVLDSVSIEAYKGSDLTSPLTPTFPSSLPNSPNIQRRSVTTNRKSLINQRASQSMPTTPRIRRAVTESQDPQTILELDDNHDICLPNLETLKITWSPDLHIDTLLTIGFHARNLTSLSLAGIHTLLEADLCKILQYLPDLTDLKLGDQRSTRAAFSSSRGLGTFHGTLLATELTMWNKKLVYLDLHGLVNLNAVAFAGLIMVANPVSDSNGAIGQTESLPADLNALPEVPVTDVVPSRNNRLSRLCLHSCTSHIEDSVLHTTLTSPLAVSNITHFAISEAHTLTDASFIDIMRALAKTVQDLQVGPGLNINELAVSSIGQFCTGLKVLSVSGLAKASDIGHFVGLRWEKLHTLILKDMKGLKEVRNLVIPARKMSSWREIVDSVTNPVQEDEFVDALEPEVDVSEEEQEGQHIGGLNFGGQANADAIAAETMAAQFGLTIPEPDTSVTVGCVGMKQIQLLGCPQLKGKSVIKIVTAMN
ncbi:UNVERIFIED_CONTAM: hypothetical protein HDU68_005042, partial [Siphonaria sp. JEL0065]